MPSSSKRSLRSYRKMPSFSICAGWCFLHGSLRHMISRSLGPQPTAVGSSASRGDISRWILRQSCCCLPDTQQEWDFRSGARLARLAVVCCWVFAVDVGKKGQSKRKLIAGCLCHICNGAVMLWQFMLLTQKVHSCICRHEQPGCSFQKSCNLRSLVDEATGAMLVSMRVVWEPSLQL